MKALSKNTYREILRSPGRFLAILAIIVLGSGFFVGLRVSQKAMKETANTYLDKTAFYDFSIVTTLGLTHEDVEALAADPQVLDAEGSFETDALVNLGGSTDQVFAFHSLPERVNLPDLVAGRLPEAPDECLADSWTNLSVGDRVTVSGENEEDTLSLFAVREFTVVGVATSPLYLNFERGSTSLGAGTVTAFCYVPPGAFDADYFTAVYLRVPDMPAAYDDDYEGRAEALEDHFTDLANQRAQARYDRLVAEAEKELADGQKEYDDAYNEYITQRADAEKELSDAKAELTDAKRELDDAAQKIADGQTEYADGQKELADSEGRLADAKAELDDAKAQLDDAAREIADGRKAYDEGVAAFETERCEAEQELADAKAELDDALRELTDGEAAYEDNRKLYENGEARYAQGAAELEANRKTLEDGEAQYTSGLATYNAYASALRKNEADYEAGLQTLEAGKTQLKQGLNNPLLFTFPAIRDTYASADELYDALMAGAVDQATLELLDTLAAMMSSELTVTEAVAAIQDGEATLAAAKSQLDSARAQLNASWSTLAASRRELDEGWQALAEGEEALAESRAELDDAKAQLDEGRAELDAGWADYQEGLSAYDAARTAFDEAVRTSQAELDDALIKLRDAEAQYADGQAGYEDGLRAYEDGLREFQDGKAALEEAARELEDAKAQYADGLQEYEDGLREYEDARAEADREFADAEAQLADAQAELDDARAAIDELEVPDAYLMSRRTNLGYVCFENDTSIVRSISSVFPVFFFLVAALICVTTVSRMVEEQRSQLGVLMALGYSRMKVMGKFLIYAGTATVIGCVSGILLGSWLIPLVVWQAYHIMYTFSDAIEFTFDLPLSAVTFALYLAAMMAVTWLSCRKEVGDVPANVIRPKPPKAGKRVLLERVPFLWNRLSFLWKVTVRNIFRYKLRVAMMVLGVAGCTALMLTGMGINDSIKNVVDYQFTEISLYDYTVTFADPLTEADREAFMADTAKFVGDALFLHETTVTAVAGREEKEVQLSAVDAAEAENVPAFMDFHDGARALPFPQKDEALLNSALAETLGVKAGDRLVLRLEDGPEVSVTVSGVFDNYIYNTVYIRADTLPGTPELNYALALKAEGADTGEALAAILGRDNVLAASSSQDMRNRIGNMMESLIYIVLLTVICAAALAFVVIYNLTNINIQERLREIATVKVLGFYDFESALYVLRENLLLTLLGAAAGIPLGLALNAFVVGQIELDMIHFTPRVAPISYLSSTALTILFSLLVDLFMLRRLSSIDPAAALKAAE